MLKLRIFIALVLWAAFVLLAFSTHYVAYKLNWTVDEYRIYGYVYYPWAFIYWVKDNYHSHWQIFTPALMYGLITAVPAFLIPWFIIVKRAQVITKIDDLHGSAEWAKHKDVQEAHLLDSANGVQLGGWQHRGKHMYLIDNSDAHVSIIAPTRSGKGVGVIVPTLIRWHGSFICLDIKGENYAKTAGARKQRGDHVLLVNPTDTTGTCAKYNPFVEIDWGGPMETRDIQNIAEILCANPDKNGGDAYFEKAGKSLLTGLITYHMQQSEDANVMPSLNGLDKLFNQAKGDPEPFFTEMSNHGHDIVSRCGNDFKGMAEKQRDGVIGTADQALGLYRDPVIRLNTEGSSFRIRDLIMQDKPVALYLLIPPSDLDRLMPFVRLFITQVVAKLTESMDFSSGKGDAGGKHHLLLMLDEFPAIGKMPLLEKALAYMAGYKIKCCMVIQDLSQLYSAYGKDQAILGNSHVQVAYAPNTNDTAEYLSKACGDTTVMKRSVSTSSSAGDMMADRVNESYNETKRALITPDELRRLPGLKKDGNGMVIGVGNVLIMIANQNPIKGKQAPYFFDPYFKEKTSIEPPSQSDKITSGLDSLFNKSKSPVTASADGDHSEKEVLKDWNEDDANEPEPEIEDKDEPEIVIEPDNEPDPFDAYEPEPEIVDEDDFVLEDPVIIEDEEDK